MNLINDLLDEKQLAIYETTSYPFNLSILHEALKLKLDASPDYEVWVPLVYHRYAPYVKRSSDGSVSTYKILISNRGRVCSTRRRIPRILARSITESGYPVTSTKRARLGNNIVIHRAVACSFIPVPFDKHPRELEVNHLDGIKTNPSLDNLEWTTNLGNQLHAVRTGLKKSGRESKFTIPVKGTVLNGEHAGCSFVLYGKADFINFGFIQSNIAACCKGRVKTHRGCSWSYASEADVLELPRGISPEIKALLI